MGALHFPRPISLQPAVTAKDIASRNALVGRIFEAALGTFDILAIHIGHRLWLYDALASGEQLTAGELASRTGTNERYIREWLEHQAVAGILTVDGDVPDERRFGLLPAHVEVLTDRDSLAYMSPLTSQLAGLTRPLDELLAAYRTGAGVPFAHYGAEIREGIAGANRVLFINQLASEWMPAMPDVNARLLADPPARIADVGCGSGWSSIALARAYPLAIVDGLDLDEDSIAQARRNAEESGLAGRITFAARDAADPALHHRYDFACAFECIHDKSDPVRALRAMRELVGPGRSALIGDERGAEKFTTPGDEIELMMYGFSILHCLPVNLVDQPSAATGTVMRPDTWRQYANVAGFASVAVLPVEHDLWRFYRLRS